MNVVPPHANPPGGSITQGEQQAIALFERSLDVDAAQREAWLKAECGDNEALLAAVESLFAAEAAAGHFLVDDFHQQQLQDAIGASVGNYRLDRLLAEGGMGAVYLAHRDDGVYTQTVAIKFIRPLLLDPNAVQRFESERQILAHLQHPNIAQVLDGGSNAAGAPYVVMEYVDGIPLNEYCDRHQLDLAERLDLFRAVCAAVQAAHRNLIVHRDIKPGNILVTHDGVPKLLDFGIAKILQADGTAPGAPATVVALTPDYASPEQVLHRNVTTSSDVYSLGVVLYELLSGRRPYSLSGVTASEAERMICQQTPPPPSAALAAQTGSKDAAKRARVLRGDLDTIIMKALRKEPERRYGSAQELSADLLNYLRGMPIEARRDSRAYRVAKFTGRHRWGVLAASLLVLSMIAGIISTSWQANLAQAQARRAQAQQLKAEKIGAFFRTILMSSSSQWMSKIRKGPNVTMAEVLDIASERADVELAKQPEIHVDVLDTIAQSLQGMGQYGKARDIALRAVNIADKDLPANHHLRVDARYHYAQNLHLKGEFDAAEREYKAALALGNKILPPDAENLALLHNDYAVLLTIESRVDEALREQQLALDLQEQRSHGKPTPPIAIGTANIAGLKAKKGDLAGAKQGFDDALRLYALLPERKYAEQAGTLSNRSRIFLSLGQFDAAEADARESVRLGRSAYGEDHPVFAILLLRQAEVATALGQYESAESDLVQGQAILDRHIDATHPYNARFQAGFGYLYLARMEYAKAQAILTLAAASFDGKDSAQRNYPDATQARTLRLLGQAEAGLHHPARAREALQRSLAMTTSLYGPDSYESRQSRLALDLVSK